MHTLTAGVLANMVEMIKLTIKSPVRLITHLLRAAALGVRSLRLTSYALELGQLPIAKWDRLLSHWLGAGALKSTPFFGLGNREVSFALAALGSSPLHNPPSRHPKVRLNHGIVSQPTIDL